MRKLVIQVPCYNEEATLGGTLSALPREVPGIDVVEWLIIDDGSTDKTVDVAKSAGVNHVIRLPNHQGLARAFMAGIEACLERDADLIVNTDGDNQYYAGDIASLIAPILEEKADVVVGSRPIAQSQDFSPVKKALQQLGSWVVRKLSGTTVDDATSGFRAYSREAAMRLNVFSGYTYTLETLLQASAMGLRVASIPVRTNPPTRESRLVKGLASYVLRSALTLLWVLVLYRPLILFGWISGGLLGGGLLICLRFLYFYLVGQGRGHIQSLILGAVLLLFGIQMVAVALIAHLISINRRLAEETQLHGRRQRVLQRQSP